MAQDTRSDLAETAHSHLHDLVEDYSVHVRRDRARGGGPYLIADKPQKMVALLADLRDDRSGVRKLSYSARETHWAYGAFEEGQPFALINVSHEWIVARLAAAESSWLGHRQGLQQMIERFPPGDDG